MSQVLINSVTEKISHGKSLLEFLETMTAIDGCSKLSRKVKAEVKFLTKLSQKSTEIKLDHLKSSNMDNLSSICDVLRSSHDTVAVLKPFRETTSSAPLVVDVVTEGGACWCKVVSRDPRALHRVSAGQGDFGQRSVVDQAERYLSCSTANLHFFRPPRVRFVFSAGVSRSVSVQLSSRGVEVNGCVIDDCELGVDSAPMLESDSDDEDLSKSTARVPTVSTTISTSTLSAEKLTVDNAVNLDITALLAFVSNLTNGFCHRRFSQPLLQQQAAWERDSPVRPLLRRIFSERVLVCCRAAADAFSAIVATVGGPHERARAADLMTRVRVMDDVEPPFRLHHKRSEAESTTGSVRSSRVFGFGERMRIPTVTANVAFIRAAASQGVRLTAITHGSRALSEAKELSENEVFPDRTDAELTVTPQCEEDSLLQPSADFTDIIDCDVSSGKNML